MFGLERTINNFRYIVPFQVLDALLNPLLSPANSTLVGLSDPKHAIKQVKPLPLPSPHVDQNQGVWMPDLNQWLPHTWRNYVETTVSTKAYSEEIPIHFGIKE